MPARKQFVVQFAIFAAASLVAGASYRLVSWGADVLGCAQHAEPGTFMAYCASEQYGVYDQGAYYFGLEPEAIANLKKAEVLFLGNSRAQFAFSTDEVRRYFDRHAIPYFTLGFGYGEKADFAYALITKYALKPKVLVIVADPFFSHGLSPPATEIADEARPAWRRIPLKLWAWTDYMTKKIFNGLQPHVCAWDVMPCSGTYGTIYRSAADGRWIWRDLYSPPEKAQLAIEPARRSAMAAPSSADVENARRILAATTVDPTCVVITVTPNSLDDAEPYAREIGRILGVNVVLPEVNDIRTIDHSHMTWSSAQRWSRAFLGEVDAVVQSCSGS